MPVSHRAAGQRFCIYHRPHTGVARAAIVYVHPFGEEMNKARRMASLQSRALSSDGFAILQMDLLGCGDSSGDFEDATWDDWVSDVLDAAHWLQERHDAPIWFWGLRAGCLLAVDAASRHDAAVNFLLWQAPASGRSQLQQFLRLKVASEMLDGQAAKGAMRRIRDQMERGEIVDIAGYRMSPALALGLERAAMSPPRHPTIAIVNEVGPTASTSLSPAGSALASAWLAEGHEVRHDVVVGPQFWQTQEIEEAPLLIASSTSALREMAPE
jgi:exosortase A-associated hydrolase 2